MLCYSCNAVTVVLTNLPDPLPGLQKDAHKIFLIVIAMEAKANHIS